MRNEDKIAMKRIEWMRIVGLIVLAIAGCAKSKYTVTYTPQTLSTRSTQPAMTQPVDVDCQSVDEMDFLECMTRKTRCSFADAVRAVGLLMNGSDVGKTYEERYQYLLKIGVVREAWRLKPDQWVDRGTIAYMLLKAGKIQGGINLAIFGSLGFGDRHYAYREMLYHNLMEGGCDYQYISGPELVTAAGNVDRFGQEYGDYSATHETALGEKPQY
jgi:hypothetical protein